MRSTTLALTITLAATAPLAADPPRYTLQVTGEGLFPYAMSAAGTITGSIHDPAVGTATPFTWRSGTLATYQSNAWPYGVNDYGVTVGDNGVGYPSMFIADPQNGLRTISVFGNSQGIAHSINNHGQVIGAAWEPVSQSYRAFIWQNGHATELPIPNGATSAGAAHITNTGLIGGSSIFGDHALPTLWHNGIPQHLPLPAGMVSAGVRRLYDANLAVGSARDTSDIAHAVAWINGDAHLLPSWGEPAYALGVSAAGDILGIATRPDLSSAAVVWSGGQLFDLQDLVVGVPELQITLAHGIDDSGRIAAWGNIGSHYNLGLILTPIPAPSTAIPIILAALCIPRRRR